MTKCPLTSEDRPTFHFKYMDAEPQLMMKHSLAVKKKKKIKEGEKCFCNKKIKLITIVPAYFFVVFMQNNFLYLAQERIPVHFMTWRIKFAYHQPGSTWF